MRNSPGLHLPVLAAVCAFLPMAASATNPFSTVWTEQLGTSAFDGFSEIAVDRNGSVFVAGRTDGDLDGTSFGGIDGFVAKFDANGTERWRRQIGTSEFDQATGVSVDGAGNAFVTGFTYGDLQGTNAGDADIFVAKYTPGGDELWRTQIGTPFVNAPSGIVSDFFGNTYVVGRSQGELLDEPNAGGQDAFLLKLSPEGDPLWNRHVGQLFQDVSSGVTLNAHGDVYWTGGTSGTLPGETGFGGGDFFVARYTPSGDRVWLTQAGSSMPDRSFAISVDFEGAAYVAGDTLGDFGGANAGGLDGFLAKFDADGEPVWTNQFGTPEEDQAHAVAVGGLRVHVAGNTIGELASPPVGNRDHFLSQYDLSGVEQWTTQFGTTTDDFDAAIAVDGANNVLFTGSSRGSFAAPNAGNADVVLAKFDNPARVAGDYNDDGAVDAADYTIWRDTFGDTIADVGGFPPADGDSSGTVDQDDYVFWTRFYGNRPLLIPNSASAAAGVPEPTPLVLLLAAMGHALAVGRRSAAAGSAR